MLEFTNSYVTTTSCRKHRVRIGIFNIPGRKFPGFSGARRILIHSANVAVLAENYITSCPILNWPSGSQVCLLKTAIIWSSQKVHLSLLIIHRWETPWAKVFPLRLVLRLGAEYRYYPCPLFSVRFRDALYFEIGHTVMKVLADFRNFAYTLPSVRGLTIHLRNRMTDVMFPRNRYDQVIKGLNNSNDHVLAYASNFSIAADSHLVCIQTNTGDESTYQTQAISINNNPRTSTYVIFTRLVRTF